MANSNGQYQAEVDKINQAREILSTDKTWKFLKTKDNLEDIKVVLSENAYKLVSPKA